ncbi:MAG TPA: terminase family protein [Candidatus Acidoferrum sp.]|nr:terminase family protein [Candidatus Acidoferrum sp.]
MSPVRKKGSGPTVLSDHYRAFPRQEQFHESKAKYRLFGGAAGPGKTTALLWEAIGQALEVAGCDTLLLRRTYPELETSLLREFRRSVPRSLYKSYNESKHVIAWTNGSTTRFGYCRNENDVYRYQGGEFLFIGLDELTHFTLKQWQFLTSRNRCPERVYTAGENAGKRIVPCMAGATNPGNIGHAWVKALWVDKVPPAGFERADLYDPRDYDFIRARLDDNPIYADDADYRRKLETLPEHLRLAMLEGDWNVFAGQYFDVFDYGRHTARPEAIRLEPWWPRWISIDWGFQHNSAVYWHCAVPGECRNSKYETRNSAGGPNFDFRFSSDDPSHGSRDTGHGTRIITYREFVQNGLSPRMLAQAIAERSGRERISEIFLSPDAFAHRTSEASISEQLGDIFVAHGLPRPSIADDDRVGGWQWMYQLLQTDSWLITDNCSELIQCLPNLVYGGDRKEDVRKMEGDDAADAARYGLVSGARLAGMHEFVISSGVPAGFAGPQLRNLSSLDPGAPHFVHGMPLDEQIQRQISATDPTSRAIHTQRLQGEAKKFFRPKHLPRRR